MFDDTPEYCIQEMKVRAFLRLIKYKEGKPGEEGYRQIVGGGSFSDFSKHPEPHIWIERISDFSSASGAYQIMKDTWESTPLSKKKDKYGIKDFSPLSQDYAALVLLKYQKKDTKPSDSQVISWGNKWADKMVKKWKTKYPKVTRKSFPKYANRYKRATGDIIQMLIDNDLDKALLTAAITWASFPDSKDGQEPSSYSIIDAKFKFRELLLQEIKGETDLHLEKGFLKKLGYNCCSQENNVDEGNCTGTCSKKHIDLRSVIPWQTQMCADSWGPKHRQVVACYKTSLQLLQFAGVKGGALGSKISPQNSYSFYDYKNVIQTSVEHNNSIVILDEGAKKATEYLDQELEKGNPILVGVRHTYFKKDKTKKGHQYSHDEYNYDKSTDHFVTVVGRGCEDGKCFYRFYEVGTSNSNSGQHDDNKLFVNNDWSITGSPKNKPERVYTLTHVRGNKSNGNFK
jgi:muramidase (phage lysozyme)